MLILRSARALQHIARPALRRTHLLATRSELEALTVPVLKDRLRSLSLKVGGKKGELVERLLASDTGDAATTETEDANGAAAVEAEPLVVDGVRVIDVGDDYDWGFDDDDDEEDAGTDMADRLARASAGDVGSGGARAALRLGGAGERVRPTTGGYVCDVLGELPALYALCEVALERDLLALRHIRAFTR